MKRIAVATVPDRGAAEVACEALEAAGIGAHAQRVPQNPYLGAAEAYEVRVDETRLDDAERLLASLSEELETALCAQAGQAEAPPEPAPRPVKRSLVGAAAVAVLLGVLYGFLRWS